MATGTLRHCNRSWKEAGERALWVAGGRCTRKRRPQVLMLLAEGINVVCGLSEQDQCVCRRVMGEEDSSFIQDQKY